MSSSEKDLYLRRYIENKVIQPENNIDLREFYDYVSSYEEVDHIVRYVETFRRLSIEGFLTKRFKYCETGDLSYVSRYLSKKGFSVDSSKGDFRYEIVYPTAAVDILFSFEVAEHIKDQDSSHFDDIVLFNYSGIKTYAKECFRILKNDGVLILTTPNACSLKAIINTLEFRNSFVFRPHVKEYSPSEVAELFQEVGFRLKKLDTFYSYFYLDDHKEWISSIFQSLNYSKMHRGDTSFFVFKKK